MALLTRSLVAGLLCGLMSVAAQVSGLRVVTSLDTLDTGLPDTCRSSAFKCAVVGSTMYRVNSSVVGAAELGFRWRLLYQGSTVAAKNVTGDDVYTFTNIEDGVYSLVVTEAVGLDLDSVTSQIDTLPIVIASTRKALLGNSWQMVSLPRHPADSLVAAVFNGHDFLMFHWHEGAGEVAGNYIDYSSRTIHQGLAYWVKVDEAADLVLDSSTVDNTGRFSLQLVEGWNQIANPYGYEILWDDVYYLLSDGRTPVTVKESQLPDKPRGIWKWVPSLGSYVRYNPEDTLAVMELWEGYWVYAPSALKVFFDGEPHFPADSVMRTGQPKGAAAGTWKFSLRAGCGGQADPANYCGVADGALAGRDGYDCPEPPRPAPGLSLWLGDGLCEDYRPIADAVTWEATVSGAGAGPVTIQALGLDNIPAGYRVYLFDPAADTWTDLTAERAAVVEGDGTVYVVAARTAALPVEAIGTRLAVLRTTPSPAADRARITLRLPVDALDSAPEMTVYSGAGHPVARLTGTTLSPDLVWNIDAARVRPGVYPFTVTVGHHHAAGRIFVTH